MAFKPLDPNEEIVRYRNHLPHWRQEGVTYFVTFRLHDSIPQVKLRQWRQEREWWMRAHGLEPEDGLDALSEKKKKEYHSRFTKTFHDWLDSGAGECLLRDLRVATLTANALRHFSGERYELGSFVVMPNHVHALVSPNKRHTLEEIMHSWKSFTAHELNGLLARKGPVWQRESYDHIVRSEEQLAHYQRYIRENPIKAKLRPGEYLVSE